jgi:hypothetical protein
VSQFLDPIDASALRDLAVHLILDDYVPMNSRQPRPRRV